MKNKQTGVEAILNLFGTGSVCLWASLLCVSTLLFILKISLGYLNVILSSVLAIAFLYWFSGEVVFKRRFQIFVYSVLLIGFVFGLSVYVSGLVYDLSFDGQAYHQEAVIQMSRGWNPVYMQLDGQATANLERWLNHYPKAIWIVATSIYKVTGNIETGKALSIFMPVVALVFCMWSLWRVKMNWVFKILTSLVLVLNPVVIYQSLSYYADGVLVSMLLILAAIGFRLGYQRDRASVWPFLFTIIAALNIKLSAAVFVIVEVFFIIMYLWMKDLMRLSLVTIKFAIVGLVVGILLVGYNPYLTNFVIKGHPFYPAMGRGAIDYVPTNVPKNYWSLVPPLRLFASIFSESSLERGENGIAKVKSPFFMNLSELETFRETNAKTGGFGPLFGAMFLLTMLVLPLYLFLSKKKERFVLFFAIIFVIALGASVSMSSVARYVPFVWWCCGILLVGLFWEKEMLVKIVGVVMSVVALVNIVLVAKAYIPYNINESRKLTNELSTLAAKKDDRPLLIDVAQFGSVKLKLNDYDIDYLEVDREAKCDKRHKFLTRNIAMICDLSN